jgi:hypothetical protein
MDLKTLTETELKSLGFDQVMLLNQAQNNLNLINQELAGREKPPVENVE